MFFFLKLAASLQQCFSLYQHHTVTFSNELSLMSMQGVQLQPTNKKQKGVSSPGPLLSGLLLPLRRSGLCAVRAAHQGNV